MLRIGFLPSDFNPMVLMLGEAGDFRALAGVLRYFARDPIDTRVDRLGFCRPGGTRLTLALPNGALANGALANGALASGARGIMRREDDPDGVLWCLDTATALGFADRVEGLAHPSQAAGSAFLACGTEAEIPVKISRGEYTEDFLTGA